MKKWYVTVRMLSLLSWCLNKESLCVFQNLDTNLNTLYLFFKPLSSWFLCNWTAGGKIGVVVFVACFMYIYNPQIKEIMNCPNMTLLTWWWHNHCKLMSVDVTNVSLTPDIHNKYNNSATIVDLDPGIQLFTQHLVSSATC